MTIKVGDRVRVLPSYILSVLRHAEGIVERISGNIAIFKLEKDCSKFYLKGKEVFFFFYNLEVIPHEPKTLADYTDQELADEWRAYAEKIHHIRKEIKDRGFTAQYRKADAAETAPWNTQTPVADPGTYNYRIFKSETVVTETAL